MQFADPQASSTAYLILRHLYDGDVIEWPIPDDHPQREIFVQLDVQGYVQRWDRVWPLHDRYRLTERGIQMIEQVYRPAGADAFFDDLRQRNLAPPDRRAYLQSQGLDPLLWPLLHDPSTHWSTYGTSGCRYQQYLWEDQRPMKRRRMPTGKPMMGGGGMRGGGMRGGVVHVHHQHNVPYLVDLDRQAQDTGGIAPTSPDYDVS
jgi:hypothetical protein